MAEAQILAAMVLAGKRSGGDVGRCEWKWTSMGHYLALFCHWELGTGKRPEAVDDLMIVYQIWLPVEALCQE